MTNQISIVIQAQDNASKKIRALGGEVESAGKQSESAGKRFDGLRGNLAALAGIAVTAGLATRGLVSFMGSTVGAANTLQSALLGLNSVANAFGQSADDANRAAQSLASDGLMTVADSATGLKNLLAAGFNLDQATTLMRRFKDSAAFGRQSALSFGQAVSSATEGVKNGNSILVDNAGVTKNLSNMLVEAGYSAQDLSRASSDAGVRQALFNGILKETNVQAGDAARLSETAAGKQAQWSAQTTVLMQNIGTALQPALLKLLETVTPIIVAIAGWVEQNTDLAAGILLTATAGLGLITAVNGIATAVTALGSIFTLFKDGSKIAINGVKTAFEGMKTLVKSPIAMPAIAVGAALIAIDQVWQAAQRATQAVNEMYDARERNEQEDIKGIGLVNQNYKDGKISKEVRDKQLQILARPHNYSLGTNYSQGGPTWINEHGPELVTLPQGARVSPAWQSRSQSASDGAGGVTNILSGNFTFQTAEAVQEFFTTLDKTQRLAKLGVAS